MIWVDWVFPLSKLVLASVFFWLLSIILHRRHTHPPHDLYDLLCPSFFRSLPSCASSRNSFAKEHSSMDDSTRLQPRMNDDGISSKEIKRNNCNNDNDNNNTSNNTFYNSFQRQRLLQSPEPVMPSPKIYTSTASSYDDTVSTQAITMVDSFQSNMSVESTDEESIAEELHSERRNCSNPVALTLSQDDGWDQNDQNQNTTTIPQTTIFSFHDEPTYYSSTSPTVLLRHEAPDGISRPLAIRPSPWSMFF